MSETDNYLVLNDRECDYDYNGDTRNNKKHDEEKYYSKNSYNYKIYKKINKSIIKKEIQKGKYLEMKQNQELELKEREENEQDKNTYKKERKRKLKVTEIENENYQNNYEKAIKKEKKAKKPRKDRIRF